jgi:isopropylmalate/homocitrate/citramalate synthase
LVELGYDPSADELDACYRRVVALADQTKQVSNRDLLAIAHQVLRKRSTQTTVSAE